MNARHLKLFFLTIFTPALFQFNSSLQFISAALADDTGKIKFGVILALTGPASGPGVACRGGMELALEDLEPEVRKKISVLFEDDHNVSQNTISAFKKMAEVQKVDGVFTFSSGCSNAVAPLAEQSKIPMLSIASDQKVVQGRKYPMSIWVRPQEEGKATFDEAMRRKYKRIARITAEHDGMIANREAFDSYNEKKIEVVLDDSYPVDNKDFKPFLIKLKSLRDVDAIAVYLYFGQSGVFARQARQYGINLPLFNNESFEDKGDVEAAGGALLGQWFVSADEPDDKLQKRYLEKHPGGTTVTLANCYDTIGLLAQAIREKRTSKEELNTFLHTVKYFKGASGPISATNDNRFTLPAAVKIVTTDGFEKVGP